MFKDFHLLKSDAFRRAAGLACVALLAACGCSSQGPRAAPVDPDVARSTLRTVLDAWKSGETPESLQNRSPSIVAQDMDWKMGHQLIDYAIEGEGEAVDANLYSPVRLQLRSPEGRESTKNVRYIVGTDPVLTVFREMF